MYSVQCTLYTVQSVLFAYCITRQYLAKVAEKLEEAKKAASKDDEESDDDDDDDDDDEDDDEAGLPVFLSAL